MGEELSQSGRGRWRDEEGEVGEDGVPEYHCQAGPGVRGEGGKDRKGGTSKKVVDKELCW